MRKVMNITANTMINFESSIVLRRVGTVIKALFETYSALQYRCSSLWRTPRAMKRDVNAAHDHAPNAPWTETSKVHFKGLNRIVI